MVRSQKPLLTLTAAGLTSHLLRGRQKTYAWNEIAEVEFHYFPRTPKLKLRLAAGKGWLGASRFQKTKQRTLSLSFFDDHDQRKIEKAVRAHLPAIHGQCSLLHDQMAKAAPGFPRLWPLCCLLWTACPVAVMLAWAGRMASLDVFFSLETLQFALIASPLGCILFVIAHGILATHYMIGPATEKLCEAAFQLETCNKEIDVLMRKTEQFLAFLEMYNALKKDKNAAQGGDITWTGFFNRCRCLHLPDLRVIVKKMENDLLAEDENTKMYETYQMLLSKAELILELYTMPVTCPPDGSKPQFADPVRAAELEQEIDSL